MQLRRPMVALCSFASLVVLSGCGASHRVTGTDTFAGPTSPSITSQPSSLTVVAGQPAIFSVKAAGTSPLSYQWQKNSVAIAGANSATYTTPAATLADSGTQFTVVVTNAVGTVTSSSATLTVTATATLADVLTYHNDIARTGQNLNEMILNPGNVSSATFGLIGLYPADGLVDAQPLVASAVSVPGQGTHNLLIVATEHDTVSALDTDTGAQIWSSTMLGLGETPSDDRGCNQVTPEIGVTSTPVIDRTRGPNGVIYLVAMSKSGSTYYQRLHALDLALGTELFGGPATIQATYPGTGDNSDGTNVIFDPSQYKERAALLLLNGVVYTSWSSHCDVRPYTGWIIGYDASTVAQSTVLNLTPNGSAGAIWMAGGGLAADNSGNIYLPDANGDFDTNLNVSGFPSDGDFGNAFLKLSTTGNQLAVTDYFEMYNQDSENIDDIDLGSGGAMVLPDLNNGAGQTMHLAVGAGKDGNLYLVNRDSMGKFNPNSDSTIYQQLSGVLSSGVFSSPAYFNNTVYFGPVGAPIQAFAITNAKLSSNPTAQTPTNFGYPGATPSISANGTSNAILWAVENTSPVSFHAYDASTLTELYNNNQAPGGRDQFGTDNKFIAPTIANGKVFVGTTNAVAVFGLLH